MGRTAGSPTTPALVAAVSEAGGLGCLGATGLTPAEIRAAVAEIRALTSRPFAVNVLLPARIAGEDLATRTEIRDAVQRDHPAHLEFARSLYHRYGIAEVPVQSEANLSPTYTRRQVEAVLHDRVPVLVVGLGDPADVVDNAHRVGTVVMGMAGSVRNAERQKLAGVDVVIAQGYEAGGHTGTVANFPLIPQVVDTVAPLPVVAAGGIADGRGLVAALALGAQAVWCGTAFLFATETDLPEEHRHQLTDARSEDMQVSRCYTGKPSRIARNEIMDAWADSGLEPLPMPHQVVLMDDFVSSAVAAGRWALVNNPGGQVAGMLSRQEHAAAIVARIARDATARIEALADLLPFPAASAP